MGAPSEGVGAFQKVSSKGICRLILMFGEVEGGRRRRQRYREGWKLMSSTEMSK